MDEHVLFARIEGLRQKVDTSMEKYALHAGLLDFENGGIIPAEKMDSRNNSPRISLTHLMSAYESALALREACKIYEGLESKSHGYAEIVATSREVAENSVRYGGIFIKDALKKMPEEITNLR